MKKPAPGQLPRMEKAEGLFFMRWQPLEVKITPHEQAKKSFERLSFVGERLQAIGQTAGEFEPSEIMLLVTEAADYAIDWLTAMAATSSAKSDDESHIPAGATARLLLLSEKVNHAFLNEFKRKNRYARALANMQSEARAAKDSVLTSNQNGGPKIDMGTPANLAVGKLFRIIQGYRDSWKIVSTEMQGETEECQKDLHPIVADIVKLEDLSIDSWESWHSVGLKVKNALALEIETGNIKRAWKLWGRLSPSIPVTAVFR
jgi:hypothetical protein